MKYLNKLLIEFEDHLYDVPKRLIVANKQDLIDFLEEKGYQILSLTDDSISIEKVYTEKGTITPIKQLS